MTPTTYHCPAFEQARCLTNSEVAIILANQHSKLVAAEKDPTPCVRCALRVLHAPHLCRCPHSLSCAHRMPTRALRSDQLFPQDVRVCSILWQHRQPGGEHGGAEGDPAVRARARTLLHAGRARSPAPLTAHAGNWNS